MRLENSYYKLPWHWLTAQWAWCSLGGYQVSAVQSALVIARFSPSSKSSPHLLANACKSLREGWDGFPLMSELLMPANALAALLIVKFHVVLGLTPSSSSHSLPISFCCSINTSLESCSNLWQWAHEYSPYQCAVLFSKALHSAFLLFRQQRNLC